MFFLNQPINLSPLSLHSQLLCVKKLKMLMVITGFAFAEALVLTLGLKLRGVWLWLVIALFVLFLLPLPYLWWLVKNAKHPSFFSAAFLVRPVFAWHFNWAVFLIFIAPLIILLRGIASIFGWEQLISVMRWSVLGIVLFWGVVSIIGLAGTIRMPELKTVEIKMPGLKSKDDGLRIVQLSDIHFSWWNSKQELFRIAQKVKELKPDLLLLTGDLVDHNPDYAYTLADALEDINPRLGIYAIIGNHDVYTDADAVAKRMGSRGVKMLRGEVVNLSEQGADMFLAGIEDSGEHWTGSDPAEVNLPDIIRRIPQGFPVVLMTHRPTGFDQVKGLPVGLTLSGHTHGGQLKLPFGGPGLADLRFKHVSGLFEEDGRMLYVSSGIGTVGFPFRLNCPAEITLIVLRAPE